MEATQIQDSLRHLPLDTPDTSSSAPDRRSPVARALILAYGLFAYACFLGVFLYAIGFVGNWFVPKSIDSGQAGPLVPSLLINGGLLSLFVVQHTIMARPRFKKWLTRFIPRAIERSTFVLAASGCLALLFAFWQPAPEIVWEVSNPALRFALIALSLAGYGIVLASSFMISHFDLFGIRQTLLQFRNRPYTHLPFRIVGLYKLVRHPLMVGFLIAFWSTPVMTVGHLFFSIMVTGYIIFGTAIEERDLRTFFGVAYDEYARRVRGLIPIPRRH